MTIDTLSNAFYQQMLLDDMYILSVCTALVDEGAFGLKICRIICRTAKVF